MTAKLSGKARSDALATLKGWSEVSGRDAIQRSFKFADFSQAWGFMTRVALAAEKADHHPDVDVRYNRVRVALSTHSEGGVTEKDFAGVRESDTIAAACGSRPATPPAK